MFALGSDVSVQLPAAAHGPDGRSRLRPADCVCQSRKSAAGSRARTASRACRPHRHGGWTRATCPAVDDREPPACCGRRRPRDRGRRCRGAASVAAHTYDVANRRAIGRRPRPPLRDWPDGRHRHRLRPGTCLRAGAESGPRRPPRRLAIGRRPERTPPVDPRRRRDRCVRRPAGLGRTPHSRADGGAGDRSRIQARWRTDADDLSADAAVSTRRGSRSVLFAGAPGRSRVARRGRCRVRQFPADVLVSWRHLASRREGGCRGSRRRPEREQRRWTPVRHAGILPGDGHDAQTRTRDRRVRRPGPSVRSRGE